jgi:hypothetical protein
MSGALAVRDRATPGDVVRTLDDMFSLADVLVRSGMLPSAIRSREAAAAIILKGRELGIGAMEAFAGITVIQGKPTVSPQLMLSLINRSGLMCDMDVTDDGRTCTVMMHRRGRSNPHRETFSMDDAKGLGLAGKDNWNKQPRVMRKWRAVAACARVVFPDVIAGMYTPEEMGAEVDDDGEIVQAEAVEVESRPAPAPAPRPGPAEAPEPEGDPSDYGGGPRRGPRFEGVIDDALGRWHAFQPIRGAAAREARKAQLINGLVSRAIRAGAIDEASVANGDGKRNASKAWTALKALWHDHPKRLEKTVDAYLAEKFAALDADGRVPAPEAPGEPWRVPAAIGAGEAWEPDGEALARHVEALAGRLGADPRPSVVEWATATERPAKFGDYSAADVLACEDEVLRPWYERVAGREGALSR